MRDSDQKPQFNSISIWLLTLLLAAGNALAADEARPVAKERSVSAGFPDRITTLDGKTYDKTTLERVDADGLLVVFAPVEGGSGSAKLKFRNLPAELRERFGYDPARSSDYETAQARGEAIWRAENAVWTEQRRTAQAEEAAWERQMRAQAESRLAAEAEQARINAGRGLEEPVYYYYPLWPGSYYATSRHSRPAFHYNHTQQRMPALGITSSPVSSTIGPMRPLGR